MNYSIGVANKNDYDRIIEIFEEAKAFIKPTGSVQWQNHIPNYLQFIRDIENEAMHKVIINGNIEAMFFLATCEKTYDIIYNGSWSFKTYVVLHRVAVSNALRGMGLFKIILDYASDYAKRNNIDGIRIDTHEKNEAMRNALLKYGFKLCGVINLDNTFDIERLAFEKKIN